MELRQIDKTLLPAFTPYLVDEARRAIEELPGERLLAFGAVTENYQTCGAIVATRMDGEMTIFSLYVDPAVRRQGVASLLLEALLSRREEDEPVMTLWTAAEADFQALEGFFTARGFVVESDEDCVYHLSCADLRRVPVIRHAFSPEYRLPAGVAPFESLSPEELAELNSDPDIAAHLRPEAVVERMEPSLSFCCRYGGKVTGYFLCGLEGERDVTILSTVNRKGSSPVTFVQLTAAAIHEAYSRLGEDFGVWLDALTEEVRKLAMLYSGGGLSQWRSGSATLLED